MITMPRFALLTVCLLLTHMSGGTLSAQPTAAENSSYFIHYNLVGMRQGRAARAVAEWFDTQLVEHMSEEEVARLDSISIFGSGPDQTPAVLLDGTMTEAMHTAAVERILALEDEVPVEQQTLKGQEIFVIDGAIELGFEGFSNSGKISPTYVALGNIGPGQGLITPDRALLERFLDNGNRLDSEPPPGLLVVRAEPALIQAGLDLDRARIPEQEWASQILRNVGAVALTVLDGQQQVRVEIRTSSASETLARSLADMIEGMISHALLSAREEGDQSLDWLEEVTIDVEDRHTHVRWNAPADAVLDFLD